MLPEDSVARLQAGRDVVAEQTFAKRKGANGKNF